MAASYSSSDGRYLADIPDESHRDLVEAELISSIAWLIRLRWLAGAGVLLATWLVRALFGLSAPTGPLYAIGASILAYNLVFYLVERSFNRASARAVSSRRLALAQVLLDWLAMTLLIHYSGGIESPAIFFFFFHIIIASIFFQPRAAFGFAFLAAALLSGTVLLECFGVIPHQPIRGLLEHSLCQNWLYVTAVLLFFTSSALIVAYLVSTIQTRLRQREEDVIRLSDSLRQATVRLQALNDGARTISSTLELPQVLNLLVKSTAEAMGVRACSIRLLDKTGSRLEPVAVYGLSQEYLDKGPVDPHTNPLARDILAGKIVNIPNAPESPLLQYPEEARAEGIQSMLSAPLIGKSGPFGIIRAYAVESGRFTKDDEAFLPAIAAQGSLAIENALAYQAIAALDSAKSQFIRIVTHELRSPVSVIRSLLRTMISGYAGQIPEQQMDMIARAGRRADYLQGLIDDLLDLATGKADVGVRENLEPVSLQESVQRVVKRYEVPAGEKELHLVWNDQTAEKTTSVIATPDGIDRIFNNLISNAVKYTPSQGTVTVTLSKDGDEAMIVVEDTGIGIPEDAMQHLFEEFYRAPNAKAIEREGTGLGLTIVKDLVTRFGGQVTVSSTVGAGSRFTITLPLSTMK